MVTIAPSIWCNNNAEELASFYTSAFSDTKIHATTHYPHEGLLDFQQHLAGKVLTIDLEILGTHFIAINAGPEFSLNPALSFMVLFSVHTSSDPQAELETLWEHLTADGTALMPLADYPFSPLYGWVEDKFGVTWQLMLESEEETDTPHEERSRIIPNLMFGKDVVNRAEEAMQYYTSVFPDSRIVDVARHEEPTGPAHTGSLMYADATLSGQWMAFMDSAMEQDFTFTEGVSLLIECETQQEIDHYWSALSHVPEAEQCGWCKDQFGVSWQIAPRNVDSLMDKPAAYSAMMGMKKIDIAALHEAAQER